MGQTLQLIFRESNSDFDKKENVVMKEINEQRAPFLYLSLRSHHHNLGLNGGRNSEKPWSY